MLTPRFKGCSNIRVSLWVKKSLTLSRRSPNTSAPRVRLGWLQLRQPYNCRCWPVAWVRAMRSLLLHTPLSRPRRRYGKSEHVLFLWTSTRARITLIQTALGMPSQFAQRDIVIIYARASR